LKHRKEAATFAGSDLRFVEE